MAWLIAPLAATMPYVVAYWVFAGLLAAAYAVTAWWVTPGSRVTKAAVVLAGATTYPVLICVHMGQVALLVGVAIVAAWALLRRGHHVAAGLALSVIFLKPQVAYLVPLALLAWGAWRAVAVSAGAAAVLAALCAFPRWRRHRRVDSPAFDGGPEPRQPDLDPAILTGPGAPAYAVEVVAAAVALTVAFLSRRRGDPGTAIVAGLVGSLLAAPYHHGADAFCLVAAFLISLNLKPSRLLAAWMAFGAVAALLEPPTGPLPLLIFAAGWLLLLLHEEIRGLRTEPNLGLVPERAPVPAPL